MLHWGSSNRSSSQHLLCFNGPSGFVNTSASISSVGQYCRAISFATHSSYTNRCFVSICFDRRLCLSLSTKVRQDWLSSMIVVGFTCPSPNSRSSCLSQMASWQASLSATYSASMVERVTLDCLLLAQEMVPPANRNTNPEVDLLVPVSPAQSESE
nr:uncharacterized protein LOC115257212 [Aedes albopictus]